MWAVLMVLFATLESSSHAAILRRGHLLSAGERGEDLQAAEGPSRFAQVDADQTRQTRVTTRVGRADLVSGILKHGIKALRIGLVLYNQKRQKDHIKDLGTDGETYAKLWKELDEIILDPEFKAYASEGEEELLRQQTNLNKYSLQLAHALEEAQVVARGCQGKATEESNKMRKEFEQNKWEQRARAVNDEYGNELTTGIKNLVFDTPPPPPPRAHDKAHMVADTALTVGAIAEPFGVVAMIKDIKQIGETCQRIMDDFKNFDWSAAKLALVLAKEFANMVGNMIELLARIFGSMKGVVNEATKLMPKDTPKIFDIYTTARDLLNTRATFVPEHLHEGSYSFNIHEQVHREKKQQIGGGIFSTTGTAQYSGDMPPWIEEARYQAVAAGSDAVIHFVEYDGAAKIVQSYCDQLAHHQKAQTLEQAKQKGLQLREAWVAEWKRDMDKDLSAEPFVSFRRAMFIAYTKTEKKVLDWFKTTADAKHIDLGKHMKTSLEC